MEVHLDAEVVLAKTVFCLGEERVSNGLMGNVSGVEIWRVVHALRSRF
jgi:hypothetical protein